MTAFNDVPAWWVTQEGHIHFSTSTRLVHCFVDGIFATIFHYFFFFIEGSSTRFST